MSDEWKEIEEAPGYTINRFGEIRYRGLPVSAKGRGGRQVMLKDRDGKWICRSIQRLVYRLFIGEVPSDRKVYLSNPSLGISADNLRLGGVSNRKEYKRTFGKGKRVPDHLIRLILFLGRQGMRVLEIAELLDMSYYTVYMILSNRRRNNGR